MIYKINLTAKEIGIINELLDFGFSKIVGKERLNIREKITKQFVKQLKEGVNNGS